MKQSLVVTRKGLCLLLVLNFIFPACAWKDTVRRSRGYEAASRDLVIEEMKEGATLWVLAIGVSKYEDPRINLRYADQDAESIAQIFKSQEGVLFNEVSTRVLVNEEATREAILNSMSRFLGQAVKDDVVLIFMSGHGWKDNIGSYYFLPHNATWENLISNGLPMSQFELALKSLHQNVEKLILLLDTCHAGAASESSRGAIGTDLLEALGQARGLYKLSASTASEASWEDAKWGHGAFTYSLLDGLDGAAASSDGVVWLGNLFSHVGKTVPRLTEGKQHPHFDLQGTDLPFFVLSDSVVKDSKVAPVDSSAVTIESAVDSLSSPPPSLLKRWWWKIALAVTGGALIYKAWPPEEPEEKGVVVVSFPVP